MAQLLSHAHVEFILDGHRFEGWADEEEPIEFPDGSDLATITKGKDGGKYGVTEAEFGGEIMVRMSPTSPTTQWLIQRAEELKQAQINGQPIRVYSGTYNDPVQGRAARVEGGFLIKCPPMSVPGKTFEATFDFERIVSDVDGATFHAPQQSDA